MADFPYTPTPASAKRFLDHIRSAGVPEKVSQKYLEKVGFKSTNDRYIIAILKFIGLVDASGVPTKLWQAYRNRTTGGKALASAVRQSYSDLFKTYPDANRKDNEALRNYFSANTKVAESTLGLIVGTFKMLCAAADFEGPATVIEDETKDALPTDSTSRKAKLPVSHDSGGTQGPAININIQLQLPATDDGVIYEKLFAALKKHLLP
jgi:hypothetical protein